MARSYQKLTLGQIAVEYTVLEDSEEYIMLVKLKNLSLRIIAEIDSDNLRSSSNSAFCS